MVVDGGWSAESGQGAGGFERRVGAAACWCSRTLPHCSPWWLVVDAVAASELVSKSGGEP